MSWGPESVGIVSKDLMTASGPGPGCGGGEGAEGQEREGARGCVVSKCLACVCVYYQVAAILEPHVVDGRPLVISHGYVYLLLGGWGYTLSLCITKKYLVHIPIGILALFKVGRYRVGL
jgi:hypothetical protein